MNFDFLLEHPQRIGFLCRDVSIRFRHQIGDAHHDGLQVGGQVADPGNLVERTHQTVPIQFAGVLE